jgi:hypothetical protein
MPPEEMAPKGRLTSDASDHQPRPFCGPTCQCLAEFFREEFQKHHRCLEAQREYYTDVAIAQAEDALARVMGQMEQLSQRADAGEVVGQLLRQFDLITKLSAWTEPKQLH